VQQLAKLKKQVLKRTEKCIDNPAGRDPGKDRRESVTLRFERGVLSKICRARS
jgi:hypothetical protein